MSNASNYQTNSPYIDRKVAEGIFRELLQIKSAYRVFNIYGKSGTGKSYFKSYIKSKYLDTRNNKYLHVEIDFENRVLHSQRNVIMSMAKDLENRYNYKFVTLWKAYAILWYKRYKNSPLIYANELPYIDEIKKLFKLDKKGNPIVEIVKGFFKDSVKKELEQLKKLNTKDIESKLYRFFVADFKNLIKQKEFKDATIIFENYHLLNEIEASTSCQKDAWIRDFIALINKDSMIVILSQDEIEWDKCNVVWKSQVKKYEMQTFARKDAVRYLNNVGIDDQVYAESIIISSESIPFWLSFAKHVTKIKKIPTVKIDLLNNFINTQNSDIIKILKMLIYTRFYNKELIEHIVVHLNIKSDINMIIGQLEQYDFIKKQDNRYVIDQIFKDELVKLESENDMIESKTFIFSYYENLLHLLDNDTVKTTPRVIDEVLDEAWHHLSDINSNPIDHLDWLNYYVDRFFMYAAWEPFIERYLKIMPTIESIKDLKIEKIITLYNNLAGLYESIGESKLARDYYDKVVTLNRPELLSA